MVCFASLFLSFISFHGDICYHYRSNSDLEGWLEDHGIKTKKKPTREELIDAVSQNWNSARDYISFYPQRGQQVFMVSN